MALLVQLVSEIDVGPAIEKVAQVQTGSCQVDGVDLEIAPVQRPVRVVVIDFASALRVFRPLNRQGNPAFRPELPARVLLPGRKTTAVLVGARFFGGFRFHPL